MAYRRLFVLIEGDDDQRFFERIIKPIFETKYDSIQLWKYAQEKDKKIAGFLRSVKAMGADCVFVTDINLAPCVTARKQRIKEKFKDVDEDRIIVVISEIESWYLAGLDDDICSKKFRLSTISTTDHITKEQFDTLIPKKFDSRIDFMLEMLKYHCIETAKRKNASFSYFLRKYGCEL